MSISSDEITRLLKTVSGWEVVDNKLCKNLKFKDFKESVGFLNRVAEVAEKLNHHPDLYLYGYNNLQMFLWTHTEKGISKHDFILAAQIDALL